MARLTDHLAMTIHVVVEWDVKPQNKTNQIIIWLRRLSLSWGGAGGGADAHIITKPGSPELFFTVCNFSR